MTLLVKKDGKDDRVEGNITAWFGLISITTKIPMIKLADNFKGTEYQVELDTPQEPIERKRIKLHPKEFFQLLQRIHNWIQKVHHLHVILKKMLKGIRLEQLEWRSIIGTGNAAETALLTGVGWGIKSSILGAVSYTHLTLPTKA